MRDFLDAHDLLDFIESHDAHAEARARAELDDARSRGRR